MEEGEEEMTAPQRHRTYGLERILDSGVEIWGRGEIEEGLPRLRAFAPLARAEFDLLANSPKVEEKSPYEQYFLLAWKVAITLWSADPGLHAQYEVDDLKQIAVMVLPGALAEYDPAKYGSVVAFLEMRLPQRLEDRLRAEHARTQEGRVDWRSPRGRVKNIDFRAYRKDGKPELFNDDEPSTTPWDRLAVGSATEVGSNPEDRHVRLRFRKHIEGVTPAPDSAAKLSARTAFWHDRAAALEDRLIRRIDKARKEERRAKKEGRKIQDYPMASAYYPGNLRDLEPATDTPLPNDTIVIMSHGEVEITIQAARAPIAKSPGSAAQCVIDSRASRGVKRTADQQPKAHVLNIPLWSAEFDRYAGAPNASICHVDGKTTITLLDVSDLPEDQVLVASAILKASRRRLLPERRIEHGFARGLSLLTYDDYRRLGKASAYWVPAKPKKSKDYAVRVGFDNPCAYGEKEEEE